mmetsp:Transcript_19630/g.35628  ORF Transcript_19630/g.35628 Transcript_19630/m.35628 type:complete len:116 (-) Transcript_19630:1061-1408(-)
MSGYVEDSVSSVFTDRITFVMNSSSTLALITHLWTAAATLTVLLHPTTAPHWMEQLNIDRKRKRPTSLIVMTASIVSIVVPRSSIRKDPSDNNIGEVEREKPQQEVATSEVGPYE